MSGFDEDEPSLPAKQQARRENPGMSPEELDKEARRLHRVAKRPFMKPRKSGSKTYFTWTIPTYHRYSTSADSSTTASDSTNWRW